MISISLSDMKHLVSLLLLWTAATRASGKDLFSSAQEETSWIVQIRRRLHKIPELEFDLPKTSAAVQEVLYSLNIPYKFPSVCLP